MLIFIIIIILKNLSYLYMPKYSLINPSIIGEKFQDKISARNSTDAANKIYLDLSEHINNAMPSFYFTIMKEDKNPDKVKYYHYNIKEELRGKDVKYSLHKLDNDVNQEKLNSLLSKRETFLEKIVKAGGDKKRKKSSKKSKRKKDDSDNSDSSDTLSDSSFEYEYKLIKHANKKQPFYYVWYDPLVYPVSSVYIPTFYSYLKPYIEVSLEVVDYLI